MSELPPRFEHVRKSARLGRVLAFAGFAALVVVAGYLFLVENTAVSGQTGAGFARALLAVAMMGVALLLSAGLIFVWSLVDLIIKVEANSFRTYDVLRDVHVLVEEQREHLRTLADNSPLSDTARAIIHRTKERTALRLAINEEIIRGDWEAAYALVELLASRHGYKNEAARLREELDRSREQVCSDQLHEAISGVHASMERQDWDAARREMDRLIAEVPDQADIRELPRLFAKARGDHKRRLLKQWDAAVQRNEVDRGIAVLKELDQYLTPNEAAALEESVRGVFQAKLHNLGVRFSLAVTDHDWAEALSTGQQIMNEFPNSRMAREVRERVHVLAARADEAATARAAQASAVEAPAAAAQSPPAASPQD